MAGFLPPRRGGSAKDFTGAIDYLLTEKAARLAGAVWDVDGGVMAGRNQ